MAIKVAQKKVEMGYDPKPVWPICANCQHYTSEKVMRGSFGLYVDETKKRCTIGHFAVKKTSTCERHEFKDEKA